VILVHIRPQKLRKIGIIKHHCNELLSIG